MIKNTIYKGILAGILISIGCIVNLSVGGICGAILFAFGLSSVILTQSKLFTGLAGFCENIQDYKELALSLTLNFIGCFLVGILAGDGLDASSIVDARLSSSAMHIVIYSIFTGIIMTISVKYAKEKNNFIPLLLGIPTFILSGMPHCVADICYYTINGWKASYLLPWALSIMGNFIGCHIMKLNCNINDIK